MRHVAHQLPGIHYLAHRFLISLSVKTGSQIEIHLDARQVMSACDSAHRSDSGSGGEHGGYKIGFPLPKTFKAKVKERTTVCKTETPVRQEFPCLRSLG